MRDWGDTILWFGAFLVILTLTLAVSFAALGFLIATFTGYPLCLIGFVPLLGLSLMFWKITVDVFTNVMDS